MPRTGKRLSIEAVAARLNIEGPGIAIAAAASQGAAFGRKCTSAAPDVPKIMVEPPDNRRGIVQPTIK